MKFNCLHCNTEKPVKKTSREDSNKFCNNACQGKYKLINETLPGFYKGEISSRATLKKVLIYLFGYKCSNCPNDGTHNGKPLSLQLEHKDGNAGNDMPDNLCLMCPNCHSQTDTYSGKNKGNGRGSRGIKR